MKFDFTDDVNGQIVGEMLTPAWCTYEGRKQGGTFYVKDEYAAKNMCEAYIYELKKTHGEAFHMIWPDRNAWKVCMNNA